MKKFSFAICQVLVSLWLMLAFTSCNHIQKVDLDNYQPNKDFSPAYAALTKYANEANNTDYDIEKTVRAMNSIELAQSQSADFLSYLEFLSKEDYSGVAPEVLRAKARLLPILQRMMDLKQQNEDLNDMWVLAQSAATGSLNMAKRMSINDVSQIFLANPLYILNFSKEAKDASAKMFEDYSKAKDLKRQLQNEVESLRLSYIDYLTEYAPIYHKYMKEWDALCLKKDKAYLDLYGGRSADAYQTTKSILEKYPTNREALLLNAIAAINLSATADTGKVANLPTQQDFVLGKVNPENKYIVEANNTIDKYTSLYPSRTAPALVAKAMALFAVGEEAKALSSLDQAAIEYPKQAADLTDLLDSYKFRSYLDKTPEGIYLLRLYHSTMEGYGLFSPNFQKACYYEKKGDIEKSSTEIYNHFFRRGNQGIYDCLLTDMEYCEKNLENSFKKLLIEHSFIDLNIKPARAWYGPAEDNIIKVNVNNRSDLDLENVRLFLCVHFTDMYPDEYEVIKTSTVNMIKHHDDADFENVTINFKDKKYSDITRVRAIAMTDDKICWIDEPNFKVAHAAEKKNNASKAVTDVRREGLRRSYSIDAGKVASLLSGINVPTVAESAWYKASDKLHVEVPRTLALLDPVFSIGELQKDDCQQPTTNVLGGSNIMMEFDVKPEENGSYPLYMYSDYFNCKVNIDYKNGKPVVGKVEVL